MSLEDSTLATPADKSSLRLHAGSTSITFTWTSDRWEHEVVVPDGRRWRSREGVDGPGDDPRWPASPPLVEVSLVAAGARPAVLGVGLAGRSHFSLSVVACPERPDTLLFEAAARVVEPGGWLGATYDGDEGLERVAAEAAGPPPVTIRWAYRIGPAGLEPVIGTDRGGPR
ncbi:MAG: hypothetical protein ACKO1M_13880 [Planctomycetota bacterium]